MQPFNTHSGIVVPLDRANVDTDLIIPKQFLKSVKRTGFGPNLFDQLRYKDEGQPGMDNSSRPLKADFVLNQPRFKDGSILLARENFGCGSSREHAPWALYDYGFRVLIAPSFADIFYNNCTKNGILPVVLGSKIIDQLFELVDSTEAFSLTVDLEKQTIEDGSGVFKTSFDIDSFRRECLLKGLDDIGLTLEKKGLIEAFEKKKKEQCPWLF